MQEKIPPWCPDKWKWLDISHHWAKPQWRWSHIPAFSSTWTTRNWRDVAWSSGRHSALLGECRITFSGYIIWQFNRLNMVSRACKVTIMTGLRWTCPLKRPLDEFCFLWRVSPTCCFTICTFRDPLHSLSSMYCTNQIQGSPKPVFKHRA